MDKKITDFLVKEIKIGKWMLAPIDLLLFVAAAVFSVMIRISVVDYTAIELPAFVKYGNMLRIVTGITDLLLAVLGAMIVYDLTDRSFSDICDPADASGIVCKLCYVGHGRFYLYFLRSAFFVSADERQRKCFTGQLWDQSFLKQICLFSSAGLCDCIYAEKK